MAVRPLMPTIQVIAGDRDITTSHQGLQLSNVDPGGHEQLQLNPQALDGIRPGSPLTVRLGNDVMWYGLVNEPGQHDKPGRSDYSIAALGHGLHLKEPIRRLYVDRDLSRWGRVSSAYRLAVPTFTLPDPRVQPDTSTGLPNLQTGTDGGLATVPHLSPAALYDAQGLAIGSLYYAWNRGNGNISSGADPSYNWWTYVSDTDLFAGGTYDTSGDLQAAGPGTGTLTATTGTRKFALVGWEYIAASSWSQPFYINWTTLAVFGNNGLTKRGTASATEAPGHYTSDIVGDAIAGLGFDAIITQDTFIVAHSTYFSPTPREQIVDDMSKLAGGWHWGTWEPRTMFDTAPTFLYHPRAADATCVISRRDCDELDVPKVRLDQLYDTALVTYRDPAGTSGLVTVTIANPLLAMAGVGSRPLVLDMGIGTAASAQVFAADALALALTSARGGGWAILPDTVQLPGGGRKPACLLKAGRDRLRIIDLPDAGPYTETDTRRFDTFRISRVEPTIDEHGVPRTRVEFDGGADLMEVLNARLAIAATLAG